MKIGILTAVRTNNNGTDLQAYAMLKMFTGNGAEAELIDYKRIKPEKEKKINIKLIIKNIIKFPINFYRDFSHEQFRKKYFARSDRTFDSSSISFCDYKVYVTGSDQIWNMDSVHGDCNFLLSFAGESAKKYSYAASLGRTNIEDWEKKFKLSKYLGRYNCVSVREKSGVDALRSIGIEARFDLDPLLMISASEWKKIAIAPTHSSKYIFVYLVEPNEQAIEYAINMSKINSWKVIICSGGIRRTKYAHTVRFVSPEAWLGYMENAELVITNSYHGMSIAISLQTEFIIFPLKGLSESNTRMKNLAEIIECPYCFFDEKKENTYQHIDWIRAKSSIDLVKNESLKYVNNIIKESFIDEHC